MLFVCSNYMKTELLLQNWYRKLAFYSILLAFIQLEPNLDLNYLKSGKLLNLSQSRLCL